MENPPLVESLFRRIGYATSRKLPSQADLVEIHRTFAANGVCEIVGIDGVNVPRRQLVAAYDRRKRDAER